MQEVTKLARLPVAHEASVVYSQRFSVAYEYPVHFTDHVFDAGNPALRDAICRLEPERCHRLAIFVDAGLAAASPSLLQMMSDYFQWHSGRLQLAAPPELVAAGEIAKNDPAVLQRLQGRLLELGIDRHSFVLAVGGGAVLDAVGLAAATVHRGVRHVRIPTTVLSQNDSGVGVKNGVNAFGIKNFIGCFAPPFAVLNDFALLATLEERDKRAGMAEAVKVALIRDAAFFVWLEDRVRDLVGFRKEALRYLIRRCAELHMRQIAYGGDPFESGSARPLDFGHWSAHKLEALSAYELRHGEAVAIGLALDARYSVLAGMLAEGEEARICRLLEDLGFALWHPALHQRSRAGELCLLAGLHEFREHLGGDLTVTLLGAIGRGVEVHEMDEALIVSAIEWLAERAGAP